MKIRVDFVSNSSSSSFVILSDKHVSNATIAKDFVDFAFNVIDNYDWDIYLKNELSDEYSFVNYLAKRDNLSMDKQIEIIRKQFDKNKLAAMTSSEKDYLARNADKLTKLFDSADDNRQVYLPWPYPYDDNGGKVINTAKLTDEEKATYFLSHINYKKTLEQDLVDVENISNETYLAYSHDTTHPKYLDYACYRTKQEYIDYIHRELAHITNIINKLSDIDALNEKNIYVINVANSGDGEDYDSIYAELSDRNYKMYDAGKYCFEIITTEDM